MKKVVIFTGLLIAIIAMFMSCTPIVGAGNHFGGSTGLAIKFSNPTASRGMSKNISVLTQLDASFQFGITTDGQSIFSGNSATTTVDNLRASRYPDRDDYGDNDTKGFIYDVNNPIPVYMTGTLTEKKINELVMVVPQDTDHQATSGDLSKVTTILFSPHYVYNNNIYSSARLVDGISRKPNLTMNGETAMADFRWIMFAPAAIVGKDFNYTVNGGKNYGSNAILPHRSGDPIPTLSRPGVNADVAAWMANPDNAPTAAMINAASQKSGLPLADVAQYFYNYIVKYSGAITYFADHPDTASSSFMVVAINDDIDLTTVTGLATLNVTYDGSKGTLNYDDRDLIIPFNGMVGPFVTKGSIDIVGQPPVNFITSVTIF